MRCLYFLALVCAGMNLHAQCVLQAPFNENFDTNATPTCWSNYSQGYGTTVQWQFANNTTFNQPGGAAGVTADHTGNGGYFAYTRLQFNTDYTLQMPDVIIVGISQPVLSFYWLHAAYVPQSPREQLALEFKNGSAWQQVAIFTTYSINWQYAEVAIPAWAGDTVSARWVATRIGNNSFLEPFRIDDVFIGAKPTCQNPDSAYVASAGTTSAWVKWAGDSGVYQVSHGIFNTTHNASTKQLVNTDSVLISGLTTSTPYQVFVRKICTPDTGMWIGPVDFITGCLTHHSLPHHQNFDVLNPSDSSVNQICWQTQGTGSTQWLPNRFSTPSGMTGPFGDFSASKTGIYMYTEASGGQLGDTADLISPKIFINPNDSAFLKFGYHMYGFGIGSLHLDIFNGNQWQNNVFVRSGQQQTSSTDQFNLVHVPLQSYIGDSIILRFRAIRGNSAIGDIAVDAVNLIDSCVYGSPNAQFTESYDSLTANGFYISFNSFASNAATTTWYFGDGISDTGQFVNHSYQSNGIFYAYQVVTNLCGEVDSAMAVIQIMGIGLNQNSRMPAPKVYPNPANGQVVVANILPGSSIAIYNTSGAQVLSLQAERPNETLDISNLPNGIYVLNVEMKGSMFIERLVVLNK